MKIFYVKIQLNEKDEYSNIVVNLSNDSIYEKDENRKLDIVEMNILSKFINLRIHYLEVDQYQNVKINVDDFENYDIIKIKDTSNFFQKHKRGNFEKVAEMWYLRIK